MKTIITLILMSIIFTSGHSQSAELSLKLENGKEYKQITNSIATIIQEVNGQKMNMIMTINGIVTFLVKASDENGYEMDTKFEKLSMSMRMPQLTLEFSSEKNDENDIFSKILGSMKNKTFEVTMSKTGKITEVKNVEALWETAINQFDFFSEMQKEQMKVQIMNAYGAEALKGNIEMVTAIYPDKPVNKGDNWTIYTKLESGMSAKMSTFYEYSDLTADYALIRGDSTIETEDKDAYIESNGMPMKYDLKGSMQSEIKVDRKTGWIIEAKINQEIKGDAYIKENPQVPNGMKIPMTMIHETLITN
jgi:hypothetical protein